jgi:hypothetical protein
MPKKEIHEIGTKINHLTYVSETTKSVAGIRQGVFKCDCGNEVVSTFGHWKQGLRSHCGCKTLKPIVAGERRYLLTSVGEATPRPHANGAGVIRMVNVRCDCGNLRVIRFSEFDRGKKQSCGCSNLNARGIRHDLTRTGTRGIYASWNGMKQRVRLKEGTYGLPGVYVAPEWESIEGFVANPPTVVRDGEEQPRRWFKGAVLGRVGDRGPYAPWNCYWITRGENTIEMLDRDRRRSVNGKPIEQACEEAGISVHTFYIRLHRGATEAEAIAPMRRKKPTRA